MGKQEKSNEKQIPQERERINLNIPRQRNGNTENGINGGMNEGYQPTRNENPNPPGSEKPSDKK
jgi:hypothetical protein